jgi:hypothetical protein
VTSKHALVSSALSELLREALAEDLGEILDVEVFVKRTWTDSRPQLLISTLSVHSISLEYWVNNRRSLQSEDSLNVIRPSRDGKHVLSRAC